MSKGRKISAKGYAGAAALAKKSMQLSHLTPAAPPRFDRRSAEEYVGKLRLLTEEHADFHKGEPGKPNLRIPDIFCWHRYRPQSHLQFNAPSFLAAFLRDVANDVEFRASRGVQTTLEWARKQFEPLQPLPKLRKGWVGLATLALEVAMNAALCWSRNIGGVPLRESEGLARRIFYHEVKPTGWDKLRIRQRPVWLVDLDSGVCFLAPDWFWLTHRSAHLTPSRHAAESLQDAASRAVSEHIMSLLVELSEDGNALTGDVPVLIEELSGISPKRSPELAVGKWVQGLTKLAMEAYERLDNDTYKRFDCWFPQFLPFGVRG